MKKYNMTLVLLAAAMALAPSIILGQCLYSWSQTDCLISSGNTSKGSCPTCQNWHVGGPYYNYPCSGDEADLSYCQEFTYNASITDYSYVTGTQNCPTTCGTVWSPDTISTDCTGQDYEYCD
jgi:hypothetical protein